MPWTYIVEVEKMQDLPGPWTFHIGLHDMFVVKYVIMVMQFWKKYENFPSRELLMAGWSGFVFEMDHAPEH